VSDDGGISGVVDWEFTRLGAHWADLSQMLRFASTDALEDALGEGYEAGVGSPLAANLKRIARGYDLARIAVGVSNADWSGPDAPSWVALMMEGLASYIENGDPSAIRVAAPGLLDI
jgi:aminoglycoside phosphotransferase (APT) family kinase protein